MKSTAHHPTAQNTQELQVSSAVGGLGMTFTSKLVTVKTTTLNVPHSHDKHWWMRRNGKTVKLSFPLSKTMNLCDTVWPEIFIV